MMTELERYLLDRLRSGHQSPMEVYDGLGGQRRLRAKRAMEGLILKREVEVHGRTQSRRFYLAGLGPDDDDQVDPPVKVDGYDYGHRQIGPAFEVARGSSAWVDVPQEGFTARQLRRAQGLGSTREGLRIKGLSLEFW